MPNIETGCFGCATAQEAIQVNRWQETSIADVYAAGECTGSAGSELALVEGEIAGLPPPAPASRPRRDLPVAPAGSASPTVINRTFQLAESLKNAATPESLLCRCEDVRCGGVAAADDWLQAKLTQRCGMGACHKCAPAPPAPAGCIWLVAAAAESRCPRPRGNAYCPRRAERRAVTATLLHHRARQGRQAQ